MIRIALRFYNLLFNKISELLRGRFDEGRDEGMTCRSYHKGQRSRYQLAPYYSFINIYSVHSLCFKRMDAARKKNKKCAACYREVVAKGKRYCIYHSQAYNSLQKQYDAWVRAYGGISKVGYMNKLLTLSQTGSWVKEVINEELKKDPKKTSI